MSVQTDSFVVRTSSTNYFTTRIVDMGQTAPTRSPRILIVRLSAIGDVIHGVPVLCALREALPEAFLGWVVEGRAGDLLDGHPALDALVRVPRGWLKSPREIWRLHRRLHELRFDTTIDLQCLTKSAIAAWLSGARRRIGKGGSDGRELSRWFHNELVAVRRHARDRTLSRLAQAAGDRSAGRAIRFAGTGRGRADGRRVFAGERTICRAICADESRRGLAVEGLASRAVW